MERHKCKLCSRTFANGRALGGHMKAHLASLKNLRTNNNFTESTTSSSSSEQNQEESQEQEHDKVLSLNYGLRENPRKCFKFADPDEFSLNHDNSNINVNNNNSGGGSGGGSSSVFIQDGESETESKNPVRKRSKLNCKRIVKCSEKKIAGESRFGSMELEPEPVSSISDTSPDEDVAMYLVMLSRGKWRKKEMKHQCETCHKVFRSSQALGGHRVTHRKSSSNNNNADTNNVGMNYDHVGNTRSDDDHQNAKVFECPFCYKVFGSGQALGGHKRSHLIGSNTNSKASTSSNCLIDLNLPAPEEEDEFSVVSDVEPVEAAGI